MSQVYYHLNTLAKGKMSLRVYLVKALSTLANKERRMDVVLTIPTLENGHKESGLSGHEREMSRNERMTLRISRKRKEIN